MKRILIGEDSNVVKNITQNILETHSYTVKPAKNGQEVYDSFMKEHFDLILIDINMPVMSGTTCATHIREKSPPSKQQVPIIAITGNSPNYRSEDFKSYGINDYVLKPIDYDELIQKIRKYIS